MDIHVDANSLQYIFEREPFKNNPTKLYYATVYPYNFW